MSALTLRLPDSLDQQIRDLAERQQLTRSDFARRALESYVKHIQQELALQSMVNAAQAIQGSSHLVQHLNEITQDFATADLEAIQRVAEDEPQGWWQ
jgi:predicted transcriptional regulator